MRPLAPGPHEDDLPCRRDPRDRCLLREVDVLENGTTPVNECLYTVFEKEFQHNRYTVRDLAHLE